MRVCRGCGILLSIDSSLQFKRQNGKIRDGAICIYCHSTEKKIANKRTSANHRSTEKYLKTLAEPVKKECEECGKNFWTNKYWQVVCNNDCRSVRDSRFKAISNRKRRQNG